MTVLHTLWLPILLSSVFVFIAGTLLHMALPWHRKDYLKVPNEDQAQDALRNLNIPPGEYVIPNCDTSADRNSAAFAEKMKKGPVVFMTLAAGGPMRMGKPLALWFIYLLVISYFAAYVSFHALAVGAALHPIYRFVGLTAFLGYAGALCQASIWFRHSWTTTIKSVIDGLIYGAITALTFGWLWPH